ncbi:MAG: YlbF family regulator [Peptococcaceae bacterium]|nr:YlbF family regulator [Peptococcaceae bacterium]
MSQEIVNQAKILGELLAECKELQTLRDAEGKFANDPIAQDLVGEYQGWQAKENLAKQEGRELAPDEQATYEGVEKQMENNAAITAYLDAQAEFSDLMESVNYLILKGINGEVDSCDSGSCSGGCSGCGH